MIMQQSAQPAAKPSLAAQQMLAIFKIYRNPQQLAKQVVKFYSPEAVFSDPMQRAKGREAIHKLWQKMAILFRCIDVELLDEVAQADKLALHWRMQFCYRRWPATATIDGVTLLRLNEQGQCVEQIDYWDIWTFLRGSLPFSAKSLQTKWKALGSGFPFAKHFSQQKRR